MAFSQMPSSQGPGSSGGGSYEDEAPPIVAEINITPLTDIFLVLLIIFMVTSSVMTQSGVDVQLPSASQQAQSSQPEGVIVTLLPNGRLKINGQSLTEAGGLEALTPALKQAFTKTTSRLVILEGDREAFLGSVMGVMDMARAAGADKFAIATVTDDAGRFLRGKK